MADESLRQMDKLIISEIWTSDTAYKDLAYLCDDIGHRFAGSDLEHLASQYLRRKMEEYGLENVRLEEFPIASWERGSCELELVGPVSRRLSAIAMPYCPSAHLAAEVVDVGEGELTDFERLGDRIKGKIVLTDAETNRPGERKSHRTDKYAWARDRGAVAVVYMNQNPGLLRITGSITGRNPAGSAAADREAPIPGIGISYENGKLLRRMAERGTLRLKLDTENRTYDSKSYNVIGELTGSEHPDEIIILGGHYDGHDIAQGAGDDGAGTIVGLEAGRALAQFKGRLKRTVRVVCWGAEEVGLLGAWYHAQQHQGEKIRFALNLDGAGRGNGGQEQITLSLLPELAEYFGGLQGELAYEFGVRDELNSHSDHFPFALQGIPNGTLNSRDASAGLVGRGYGHTEADTLDKVQLRGLQMSAVLVARLVLRLAQDDTFPGRQRDQDEVRQQLKDAGIHDRVVAGGRFPAEVQ